MNKLTNTLKRKNNKKGFTLIELIVVIAILAILAAIAIPRFGGARQTANAGSVLANLRTIDSAVEMFATSNNVSVDDVETDDAKTMLTGNWPDGPGEVEYTVESGIATATLNGLELPSEYAGLSITDTTATLEQSVETP